MCGAGTSLAHMDISGIHEYPITCVNSSIILMPWEEPGDALHRFWMSTDILCMQWDYFKNKVAKCDCTRIVRNSWARMEKQFKGIEMNYYVPRRTGNGKPKWKDEGIIASSSILSGIDFSLLMGCKEVYLLGVDHKMADGKSHFWQLWPKKEQPKRDGKPKEYMPCQRQQSRVFKSNFRMFEIVNKYANSIDAKIYNCSSISDVDVFEKISLEDALKK